MLFNLYEAFDQSENSHKFGIFYPKSHIFLHSCAIFYELPSNISTMVMPNQQYRIRQKVTVISFAAKGHEKCFFLLPDEFARFCNKKVLVRYLKLDKIVLHVRLQLSASDRLILGNKKSCSKTFTLSKWARLFGHIVSTNIHVTQKRPAQ